VQYYLNNHGNSISNDLQLRWCEEAAEDLSYCHGQGVLRCDLRPDNLLLDGGLGLKIYDLRLGIWASEWRKSSRLLPFSDPREEDIFTATESIEIHGVGSIMYSI